MVGATWMAVALAPVRRPAADAGRTSTHLSLAPGERAVPSEGDYLVNATDHVAYVSNPPASGAQLRQWAPWRAFDSAVPRGAWLHNLAHGGVALLYRPDAAPERVAALRSAYAAIPDDPRCGHRWALLTPDPELEPEWAVVAWGRVLTEADVDEDAVVGFVLAHRGGRQALCPDGELGR